MEICGQRKVFIDLFIFLNGINYVCWARNLNEENATTAYLHRHNLVAAVIHWHLMRFYSFQSCSRSWYSPKPPPVIESSSAKILWDFRLVTNHNHPSNRPDIKLYDFCQQEISMGQAAKRCAIVFSAVPHTLHINEGTDMCITLASITRVAVT